MSQESYEHIIKYVTTTPANTNKNVLVTLFNNIKNDKEEEIDTSDKVVKLIDWEGTILKEYNRNEIEELVELPTPDTFTAYNNVDHELLLFQEWNWSLANIKAWLTSNPGERLNIVAIYTTTDGQNHNYWDSPRGEGATKISSQKRGTGRIVAQSFANYYSLENINVQKTAATEYIGNFAFENDYNLRFIGLPNTIGRIDEWVFKNCYNLVSIILPEGLTGIGGGAFQACYSLESIFIPDSATRLGNSLFKYCYSLKNVHISSSATSIEPCVFGYCYSLNSIRIPNSVTAIRDYAFADCISLYDIILEGKPTLSSTNVFNNTPTTQKIYVPRANISWFEGATNWSTLYSRFVAIEDNIAYLESLGYNVDKYKN